tara:strand:+ start:3759 stop:4052 length:294 start_codon:yes stop_codon:yes gene_type:complete
MKKLLILLISIIFLNACAQSTALIGPAITIGNTGNIMQAGYSYGTNMAVKHSTGKTPGEHVTSYIGEKKQEKRIRKELAIYLESHIKDMRNKLIIKK